MEILSLNISNLPTKWIEAIGKVQQYRGKTLELLLNGWEVYNQDVLPQDVHCYLQSRYLDEMVTGCSRVQADSIASRMASNITDAILSSAKHHFLVSVLHPNIAVKRKSIVNVKLLGDIATIFIGARPGWYNLDYTYDEINKSKVALDKHLNSNDCEVLDDFNDVALISGTAGYPGQHSGEYQYTYRDGTASCYELLPTSF